MSNINYNIDIVMCIDATGSMSPVIELVKNSASGFHDRLSTALEAKEKKVDQLRVRVVAFRDILEDGLSEALVTSEFMTLPDESDKFKNFVSNIQAKGGGDEPESGFEALATAINSDWTKEGDKRRHLVVLWTDASAHKLEDVPAGHADYPSGMPKNFEEFVNMWDGQIMEPSSKRMIVFAPDTYPWRDIAENCESVFMIPSQAGKGLADVHYDTIISNIVNSIG